MSEDLAGRVHPHNRLLLAVARTEQLIALRKKTGLGANGMPFDYDKINQNAKATSDTEVMTFQSWQSQAFAGGKLSKDEAMWLFNKLGRNGPSKKKFDALPLAERIVINTIMHEIGEWKRRL